MLEINKNNLPFVTLIEEVGNEIGFIANLYTVSNSLWEKEVNEANGVHLIEGVTVSSTKTEAINDYISKLISLATKGQPTLLRGYNDETIASKDDELISIKGILSATPALDNRKLFTSVLSNFLGYDLTLINMGIESASRIILEDGKRFRDELGYVIEKLGLQDSISVDLIPGVSINKQKIDQMFQGYDLNALATFYFNNKDYIISALLGDFDDFIDPVHKLYTLEINKSKSSDLY